MNQLPRAKREQIIDLLEDGATVRETAKIVGCNRETVCAYSIARYRRRVLELIDATYVEMKAVAKKFDLSPTQLEVMEECLANMHGEIGWTCPIHPEAEMDVDIDVDSDCRLCHAAGVRRFHERRKAEGRPVLPPWYKKKTPPDP